MKGKKSDSHFISEFITCSIRNGFDSQEKIVSHAKDLLQEIDKEIRKIEEKKIMRSKLLDVVFSFEKPIKLPKTGEARLLSFFQIQHPFICKYICNILKVDAVDINKLDNYTFSKEDFLFCIKQLLEHKILSKVDHKILKGDHFDEYMKFVLYEEK